MPEAPPRRASGASPRTRRSQQLARETKIMRAAIEELAWSDYGGMTVEAVAARAGVNKTTVYRKWETKAELIRAALHSTFELYQVGPSEGDLRADLLRLARSMLRFIHSFEGQCLLRLRLLQHPEPKLAKIAKDLIAKQQRELSGLWSAAIARGELSADVDVLLLTDMLWGAIYARVVMKSEAVDDALLVRMVDLLIGALDAPDKHKARKPRRAPPR